MASIAVQASIISIFGLWIHIHILPSAFIVSNNHFDPNDKVAGNADIFLWSRNHEYVGSDHYFCASLIHRHAGQPSL
jgi:hypothetical protein